MTCSMRKIVVLALSSCMPLSCCLLFTGGNVSDAGQVKAPGKAPGDEIVHMVFVTLKENTLAERDKLIALCKKYLAQHPGQTYFRVGPKSDKGATLEPGERENFDVGWVNVFTDGAALKKYQQSADLNEFRRLTEPHIRHMKVFDVAPAVK
jgi:hypothetical protein